MSFLEQEAVADQGGNPIQNPVLSESLTGLPGQLIGVSNSVHMAWTRSEPVPSDHLVLKARNEKINVYLYLPSLRPSS